MRVQDEIDLLKLERQTLIIKSDVDKILTDIQIKRLNGDIHLLEKYQRVVQQNKKKRVVN